mgnify:CR=1 FL=1
MYGLYVNRWTISVLLVIIGAVLYACGLGREAAIGVPVAISFVIMSGIYHNKKSLSLAYLSGVMLGIASIVWIYSLVAFVPLVAFLYGPMKGGSLKLLWSFIFGIISPAWICLPIWLYFNQEIVADAIRRMI